MTKVFVLVLWMLIVSMGCYAQEGAFDKSRFPQVTLTLTPIVIKDGHYYNFNGNKGTFESVLVPLTLLNDNDINSFLRKRKVTKEINKAVLLASFLYVLYDLNTVQTYSQARVNRNRSVLLGSFVISQVLSVLENNFKRKAVNRYNDLVFKPQAWLDPGKSVSLGVQIKF